MHIIFWKPKTFQLCMFTSVKSNTSILFLFTFSLLMVGGIAEHQRTFVILKPETIQRGISGQVLTRYEQKGLKIAAMKFVHAPRDLIERHYADHRGKGFFDGICSHMSSAPIIALVLTGKDAIAQVRKINGATKIPDAAPGTIRFDFGMDMGRNLVHASDSVESAEKEIAIWFNEKEIVSFMPSKTNMEYLYEEL